MIQTPWVWLHNKLTTGIHGAGSDYLALFGQEGIVVTKFTPISVDYMFRRNIVEDSCFVGAIAGNPTSTSVVYDGDSREKSFPDFGAAAGQWGRVVLHNITRGNSRLIAAVDLDTNTITTEASTDDWADDDVITTGSLTCVFVRSGHTYSQFFDVDLSDEIPATAIAIMIQSNNRNLDGAADGSLQDSLAFHPFATYAVGKTQVQRCMAAYDDNAVTRMLVVNSQKICMGFGFYGDVTASGMVGIIRVVGYWE